MKLFERLEEARTPNGSLIELYRHDGSYLIRADGVELMSTRRHLSEDRLAEVAAELQCEVVVNVQGDEPLIAPQAIDAAVGVLEDRPGDAMATLRRRIENPSDFQDPSVVKLAVDRQGYALYFSRAAIPFVRPSHAAPVAWRHMGLYVYRREFLQKVATLPPTPLEQAESLEQLRALEHGIRIKAVETLYESFGVDTPEDLEQVRRLLTTPTSS